MSYSMPHLSSILFGNVSIPYYPYENEHYSTLSGLIRLVIFLECFIEITPDFLCPFMND